MSSPLGTPPAGIGDDFAEVSGLVREVHGIVLEDGRRAEQGESGGAWIANDGGVPVVVKWVESAAAARCVLLGRALDVARGRGVRLPSYRPPLVVPGYCVLVQERVDGVVGPPSLALLDDVHAAADLLVDIPAPHHLGGTWGDTMTRSLRTGLTGWCEHDALLGAGGRFAAVVDHARSVGDEVSASAFGSDDLMHLDLHTKNVLQTRDGQLAGIIDWESACAGDVRFDLVYFAFAVDASRPGLTADLWSRLERTTPPPALRAYVAHAVLRMVDWSFRHHGVAEARKWLEVGEARIRRC